MSRCTLLVLCHLAHLAHVAAMRESYVVLDDTMVCECKEVNSVTDCPDYKIKKDGFPPSFPRYYHEKVQSELKWVNLCCRMAPKKKKGSWGLKLWKSSYVAQNNKERCLEETRPLQTRGCCSLVGSTEVYGGAFQLFLKSAKVYSMAHPKMLPSGNPTWKDYEKKSKVFMEPEGILGAKINGGKNILPKELLPEMEGIKKLMKKDGDLQCEEDLAQAIAGGSGYCRVRMKEPLCCCAAEDLDMDEMQCLEMACAPKGSRVHMIAEGLKDQMDGPIIVGWKTIWPDPYETCPQRHKNFVKVPMSPVQGHEGVLKSCDRKVTRSLGSVFHRVRKTMELCVEADFELPCPAGKVMYRRIKGWHIAGNEFSCPAGFKSNLPGDPENDSRCKWD